MAKKVRFPLEMEDGVEVRSMEELRDNFSLSRLLEYFNDGRLVTWLQDRYENTIAEEIAAINPNEEDVEKKIEGADKILDYYRASKGAFLCIQKNKKILHYGYIIKQSL